MSLNKPDPRFRSGHGRSLVAFPLFKPHFWNHPKGGPLRKLVTCILGINGRVCLIHGSQGNVHRGNDPLSRSFGFVFVETWYPFLGTGPKGNQKEFHRSRFGASPKMTCAFVYDFQAVNMKVENLDDVQTWSLHDPKNNGSMPPLFWVMTNHFFKGHEDSR